MKKKILIVDDSSFMRKCIRYALRDSDYEIIEGSSGKEAIDLYKLHQPEIVSLDVVMEDLDGFEALETILSMDASANVIICSSMVHKDIELESLEKGAKAFVKKPFQNDLYHSIITSLLKK